MSHTPKVKGVEFKINTSDIKQIHDLSCKLALCDICVTNDDRECLWPQNSALA